METLGAHMGIEGGQKKPKKLPKKYGKGENEKKWTKFVNKIRFFGLLARLYMKLGVQFHTGSFGGTLGLRRGLKLDPKWAKTTTYWKKIKKIEIINNQGPLFFFWFQAQMMKFGVEVHIETFVANIGIEGGQK